MWTAPLSPPAVTSHVAEKQFNLAGQSGHYARQKRAISYCLSHGGLTTPCRPSFARPWPIRTCDRVVYDRNSDLPSVWTVKCFSKTIESTLPEPQHYGERVPRARMVLPDFPAVSRQRCGAFQGCRKSAKQPISPAPAPPKIVIHNGGNFRRRSAFSSTAVNAAEDHVTTSP